MNGPYYRNPSRSVPVQKPKVVSIPVHFVSSDHQPQTNISTLKHSSALKIQKVFRGHTVKKSVNKIISIKNQVNEIEKRLQNDVEFVDLLRNDAKERLRVNETLMSLLFKLDSVRGVENGVRELRKSVAKKAVVLQEKVDSIAQSFDHDDDDVSNGDDDVSNSIRNKVNGEDGKEVVVDDDVSKNEQNSESVEDHVIDDVNNNNCDQEELVMNDDVSSNVRNRESLETEQDVKEGVEKKCDEDDVSKSCCDHETVVNDEDGVTDEGRMKECGGGDDDVSKSCCDKEMVEKLMCDNAKMMKLMIQISERNEMQTRMINSLSKRVEQLEKAFMSDKSRRRKKCYTKREKDGFCI
ncbi:IQ motif, EF-hand binding site, BAG domain protein [Artemisia annua]|uniref:IQ motif, EF-hand binding site, BAG domain protein n=1 Tax=Artemisia annua TaxID=35608 RepID=A0A2U1KXA8_ARTAN|nr:IQ motif, EF-hand binding site, BAG domain protein [Artemisia annua]